MIILVGVLVFGAVALLVFAYGEATAERHAIKLSLRNIDDRVITRTRERELLGPISSRVFVPLMGRFGDLGRRLTPKQYIEQSRKKLTMMGKSRPADLERFLAIRALTVAAIPALLFLVFVVLGMHSSVVLAATGLLALVLFLGPDAQMNKAVVARQTRIRQQLPDMLDLLTISVEAGLGFEQALDRTISRMPGELSDEFTRMVGEVRAGSGRADAMRAVDARTDVPELRSFVLAILQADTFGVSISRILRTQSKELRIKRRQKAQEQAQKAPVKMLIPMVFCIFPAMFVVLLGPAAINIMHGFK